MKKRKVKLYCLSMCGMSLVVLFATLFPQIVFAIQDQYQMKSTQQKARNSLNVSQLHSIYTESMQERMGNFATMDNNSIIVTALEPDFENDAEMIELLQDIYQSEWMLNFQYIVLSEYNLFVEKNFPFELLNCKKYMVYNEDYQEGVALMLWYFDIDIVDRDLRVQLLVDSVTNSVYYMRVYGESSKENAEVKEANGMIVEANVTDAEVKSEGGIKTLYTMMEQFAASTPFYREYYESDTAVFWDEGAWHNIEVTEENDKRYVVSCHLPYGETELMLELLISFEDNSYPRVSVGIPMIAELVPEMIQD